MKSIVPLLAGLCLLTPGVVRADELSVSPEIFKVGKWPEELGLVGQSLWVAESGQRTLGEFNASTGELIQRVGCGRLPVNLEVFGENLFATVNTDGKIWRQQESGKGAAIVTTGKDYPQGLSIAGEAIFVLLNLGGSDAGSVVMRIESDTHKTRRSIDVGPGANNVVTGEGYLWVLRNESANGVITRVDPETLDVRGHNEVEGWIDEAVVSDGLLYLSGGSEEAGRLTVCNAETGELQTVPDYPGARIIALKVTGELIVSIDLAGAIHLHRKDTLEPIRTIRLEVGEFSPTDILVSPESLYVSAHLGDVGVVYKIDGWRPDGNAAPTAEGGFLESESLGGISLGMSEAELTKSLGIPEKRGDAFENAVAGGFLVEAAWPSQGLVVMLASGEKGSPGSVDSVRVEGASDLVTAAGIGIGSSLKEVRQAYGKHEDKVEFPVPNPPKGKFTFVAGSIYGGVILGFEAGKVSSILLGAGAE